ncbi:MAG: [Fe-Fe] hydrogenase large subunit C-terminal domain-containing protein, partial [Clostridia bacterium]
MSSCLELKESNCKNCYKCIRSCPVKSIRFADGQAHIVEDDCILCGQCHVVCPNDAKKIRNDIQRVKAAMKGGKKVIASLAPSFVANYNGVSFDAMKNAIKALGFADVEETAIGATVVKKEYEKIVAEGKQSVIISTCCHSVNTLIQKYYPTAIGCLAKVKSPMHAHCEIIKAENPGCYTVFIGPCISKKAEAETVAKDAVDCVLTYEELSEWMAEEKIVLADTADESYKGKARLFPVSGGILRTMELDEEHFTYMAIDGTDACINALKDIEDNKLSNCFIEMSACHGSCVNGPVMERNSLISGNSRVNRFAGRKDFDIDSRHKSETSKAFNYEGRSKAIPGKEEIEEILRKMGKTSPEQE